MWWWRRRRWWWCWWWWWWWWWWWLWLCRTSFISIIVVKWWKTSSLACVKSTTLTAVASPRRPLYDAREPHRDEVRSTPTSSVPSVQCELISFESSSTTWRHRSVRRRARAQKWRRAAERLKEQSKITTETRRRATRRNATRRDGPSQSVVDFRAWSDAANTNTKWNVLAADFATLLCTCRLGYVCC